MPTKPRNLPIVAAACLLWLVAACSAAPVQRDRSRSEPVECASDSSLKAEDDNVTFYGTILPLLNSRQDDAVYKCTTCHEEYEYPETLEDPDEFDATIESMESGSMPRGGDRVADSDIAKFKAWAKAGFPLGEEKDEDSAERETEETSGTASLAGCD